MSATPSYPITLLCIVVGVVAFWLLYRATVPLLPAVRTVPNLWPKVMLTAGLLVVCVCWLFVGNLLGIIAGGFTAIVGAILLRK